MLGRAVVDGTTCIHPCSSAPLAVRAKHATDVTNVASAAVAVVTQRLAALDVVRQRFDFAMVALVSTATGLEDRLSGVFRGWGCFKDLNAVGSEAHVTDKRSAD